MYFIHGPPVFSILGGPTCLPYVFGKRSNGTCGELPTGTPHGVPITELAPSPRDSESWRTYSEAFYSGAMLRAEVTEVRWLSLSTRISRP